MEKNLNGASNSDSTQGIRFSGSSSLNTLGQALKEAGYNIKQDSWGYESLGTVGIKTVITNTDAFIKQLVSTWAAIKTSLEFDLIAKSKNDKNVP